MPRLEPAMDFSVRPFCATDLADETFPDDSMAFVAISPADSNSPLLSTTRFAHESVASDEESDIVQCLLSLLLFVT